MIKKYLLFGIALYSNFIWAQDSNKFEIIDGVVAVVGNTSLLHSDIQTQRFQRKMQGQDSLFNLCETIEDLLIAKLLLHKADLDSIKIPESQVDMYVNQRLEFFISQMGSEKALEDYFGKKIPSIRQQIEKAVIEQFKVQEIKRKLLAKTSVNLLEVKEFYDKIPKDSIKEIPTTYEYSLLLVQPYVSEESKQNVINKLKEIREKVLKDEGSFGLEALLYSQDPGSANKRGRYNGVQRGKFVKEFEKVAFHLKEGEISMPFKTPFGYHIIQLHAKRGNELDLSHILMTPKTSQKEVDTSLHFANFLQNKLDSNLFSLADITPYLKYSESKFEVQITKGDNTMFSAEQTKNIPDFLLPILEKASLQKWESPIYIGSNKIEDPKYKESGAVVLLKIDQMVNKHFMSWGTDFSILKNMALLDKQQKDFLNWVKKFSAETGLSIHTDFQKCTFKYPWNITTP